MDEQNDVWSVLENFQRAFRVLVNKLDLQDQQIQEYKAQTEKLEDLLFDDIINPARDSYNASMKENRFNEFSDQFGEKLGGYNDALKSIEGDDFDLTQTAFDEYDSMENKPDAGKFVDALTSSIDEQLAHIREAVGAKPDAEVTITQSEEGETPEVAVDGEPVPEEVVEEATAGENDTNAEEEEEIEIVDELPEEDNSEEIAALEKEAEEAIKKAGKLPGRG